MSTNEVVYSYRHIWPYEHARVRLHCPSNNSTDREPDDYVNASYVQPLGTDRRYIATQGPLEATFNDFWRYVYLHPRTTVPHNLMFLAQIMLGAKRTCHCDADKRDGGVDGQVRCILGRHRCA